VNSEYRHPPADHPDRAASDTPAADTPPRSDGPSRSDVMIPASPAQTGTLRSTRAWAALLAVLILGLATDLASKYIAFHSIASQPVQVSREDVLAAQRSGMHLGYLIPPHQPVTVVPNVLELTLVLNPGAVFGMGAGKRWFFITFTVGALGLALWMFGAWTRPRDKAAHIAIGLLVSGGLGNLYDRLVYASVRDFIHPLPGVTFPGTQREIWPYVSNLADLYLLIGIAILMWHLWRHGKTVDESTQAPLTTSKNTD
jgi:signal peptidase II